MPHQEEKSHRALENHCCPICTKVHAVGVLLDTGLKNTLPPSVTTGYGLCPECKKFADDGYIALVACDPDKTEFKPNGNVVLEGAYRTGEVVRVRRAAWSMIFDLPAPGGDFVFLDQAAVAKLQKLQQVIESPQEPT